MTGLVRVGWGALLVAAVAWPARAIGPLDGVPFDTSLELVLFAIALPALWVFCPAFIGTRAARTMIMLLVVWKALLAAAAPQAGWCGDFLVANAKEIGGYRDTWTWDVRTWTRAPMPVCTAVMARPYERPTQFPGWVINIPYSRDVELKSGRALEPTENARPPRGEYMMNVLGYMNVPAAGTLSFGIGNDVRLSGSIDDRRVASSGGVTSNVGLEPGSHLVNVSLALSGRDWKFVPLWNGRDVFAATVTTLSPVGWLGRAALTLGRYVTPLLALLLLGTWIVAAVTIERPPLPMTIGTAVLAAAMSVALMLAGDSKPARLAVLPLAAAAFIPVPERLRTTRGAWLLVGVPWLALIAVLAVDIVGRFTLYSFGDDMLTYQRYAYRIFMEGYWLEGGQRTFWNQPLYRWICGVLHLFFGDSSAGEVVWDGFGLLIGAMFAFCVVDRFAGFRAGIVTAVAVLVTVSLGPNWYLIGRGLSEISGAAWLYLAALGLMASSRDSIGRGALAGMFAVLAFYTRLNHLPLAFALIVITLLDRDIARSLDLGALWARLPKRTAATYLIVVAVGVAAFAARTWFYTGEFSVFAGTTRTLNGTGLGLDMQSLASREAWGRALESVLMIATVQDPPRFDIRSILVLGGVALSILALIRVPVASRVPIAVAILCVMSLAGGIVARGVAYPGRFSVHLIPIAVAASMLTLRPS